MPLGTIINYKRLGKDMIGNVMGVYQSTSAFPRFLNPHERGCGSQVSLSDALTSECSPLFIWGNLPCLWVHMFIISRIITGITQYLKQIIGNNVASCSLRAVLVSRFPDENGKKEKVNNVKCTIWKRGRNIWFLVSVVLSEMLWSDRYAERLVM